MDRIYISFVSIVSIMLMKDIQDSPIRMLNSTAMIIQHSIDAFDIIAIILHHVATNYLSIMFHVIPITTGPLVIKSYNYI